LMDLEKWRRAWDSRGSLAAATHERRGWGRTHTYHHAPTCVPWRAVCGVAGGFGSGTPPLSSGICVCETQHSTHVYAALEPGASSGVPVASAQAWLGHAGAWWPRHSLAATAHLRGSPDGAQRRCAQPGSLGGAAHCPSWNTDQGVYRACRFAGVIMETRPGRGESDRPPRGRLSLHGTPAPASSGQGFECLRGLWDPKGGELYRTTTKPWETAVEVGSLF